LQHYAILNNFPKVKEYQAKQDKEWLDYLEEVRRHKADVENLKRFHKQLFKKVCFKAIDKLERPYIFAYSAFVDDAVKRETSATGFDDCLECKLTPEILQ